MKVTSRVMPDVVWDEVKDSINDRIENLEDLKASGEEVDEDLIHMLDLAVQEIETANVSWGEVTF